MLVADVRNTTRSHFNGYLNVANYLITLQAVKGKVGVIMAGKNQRENMDWVMTELDLHHVKERDVEVSIYFTLYNIHAAPSCKNHPLCCDEINAIVCCQCNVTLI